MTQPQIAIFDERPDLPGSLFALPPDMMYDEQGFHTVVAVSPGVHNGGEPVETHLVLHMDTVPRVLIVTNYIPGWATASARIGRARRLR